VVELRAAFYDVLTGASSAKLQAWRLVQIKDWYCHALSYET